MINRQCTRRFNFPFMNFLFITFLSAFLLFQVQPLIAKQILPHFGGGAAVWTACMLFFQALLFVGYLYAHILTKLHSVKNQAYIHMAIIIFCWLFLPVTLANVTVSQANSPLAGIMVLLGSSVGLPYFLLATTGPLLQRWLSVIELEKLPYKLYSLSNAGSLLALLSFPFIFEPLLTVKQQASYWSILFVLLSAFLLMLCFKIAKENLTMATTAQKSTNERSINLKSFTFSPILWLLLAAVGVVLLISTTNAMTQNLPPVPFLWVMPLCLYLLSFIICFHSPHWYVRWYCFLFFAIAGVVGLLMYFIGSQFGIVWQIFIYAAIMFSGCMICHGELAKLQPKVEQLTFYYLMIALGGFIGSAFVTFVAQQFFQQFSEYPLGIIAVFILMAGSVRIVGKTSTVLVIANFSVAVLLAASFAYLNQAFVKTNVYSERNFYGIISVKDVKIDGKMERRLIDGTTSHGTQSLETDEALIPLSYYRKNTGVGVAISVLQKQASLTGIKAGVVGLGAGTLAAYGKANDEFHFYELNPAVIKAANNYFSYLSGSKAKLKISQGDARVTLSEQLKKQGSQQFDLLVIDAFAGDAVPQHLLTQEAFELYFQHLTPEGVLAIHVSNSHLNLALLVNDTAAELNKVSRYFLTKAMQAQQNDAQWILLSSDIAAFDNSLFKAYSSERLKGNLSGKERIVWTDDHSNLLSILK